MLGGLAGHALDARIELGDDLRGQHPSQCVKLRTQVSELIRLGRALIEALDSVRQIDDLACHTTSRHGFGGPALAATLLAGFRPGRLLQHGAKPIAVHAPSHCSLRHLDLAIRIFNGGQQAGNVQTQLAFVD